MRVATTHNSEYFFVQNNLIQNIFNTIISKITVLSKYTCTLRTQTSKISQFIFYVSIAPANNPSRKLEFEQYAKF